MNLSSHEIAKLFKTPPPLNPNQIWTRLDTDTREMEKGSIFLALKGENFDGHNFIKQALENGAQALVVSQEVPQETLASFPEVEVFKVSDTQIALQKMARLQSEKFKGCIKVALTGTSGKTTTKYFAHQILGQDYPHFFSPKSFNNHIGVPLSLLSIKEKDQMALLEVGMNHPGEIENLCEIIQPDVTLVTMVGRGHLEGLGSLEKVLEEKMSIYQKGHVHILNQDDLNILRYYKEHFVASENITQIKFSRKSSGADVYMEITDQSFTHLSVKGHILGQEGQAEIPISGAHNLTNILAATCIASHSNLDVKEIWYRLQSLRTFWGRSEILKSQEGIQFYFDAYNANPESMEAFLKQMQHLKTQPYLILGEMLELGESASDLHYELGRKAAQAPHQKIWFIGPNAKAFKQGYESKKTEKNLIISDTYKENIALEYKNMLKGGDWLALKGSRGMHLENFLSHFNMI